MCCCSMLLPLLLLLLNSTQDVAAASSCNENFIMLSKNECDKQDVKRALNSRHSEMRRGLPAWVMSPSNNYSLLLHHVKDSLTF